MPILIKTDENLPNSLIALLSRHGYESATVKQQGWGGLKDVHLWPLICKEGRFFITADKEFGDTLKYAPGTHPGILVLHLDEPGVRSLLKLVNRTLQTTRLDSLVGSVVIATERGLTIRRPDQDKNPKEQA